MKTINFGCDICRTQLPLSELTPLHFERSPKLGRDILTVKKENIQDATKHICADCLHDFGEVAKTYEAT